eukprot:10353708-Heterocapsa_arctica.AAC.1
MSLLCCIILYLVSPALRGAGRADAHDRQLRGPDRPSELFRSSGSGSGSSGSSSSSSGSSSSSSS